MTPDLERAVERLLRDAGETSPFSLQPIPSGGNNRVFRVALPAKSLLLKAYFRHPDDPRDRLGAEFGLCRFAWDRGLRCVPQPIGHDPELGLGLYEFIEGRKPAAASVGRDAVEQALAFFHALNEHRADASAARLPAASEACFSLADHLACVGRRVERLAGMPAGSPLDAMAAKLVRERLVPAFRAREAVIRSSVDVGEADRPLAMGDRRISPSDFGFHNALVTPAGRLRFFDFEYSGWDDPAKTVGDFFSQVQVPVPVEHFDFFCRGAMADQSDSAAAGRRARLLLPLYRIKWCCIVLNDFLPADAARRRFAKAAEDADARKEAQLRKAASLLEELAA